MTAPAPLPLVVAFAVTVVATGVVRALALRRGALDAVDPSRRLHTRPTPRLGGVGIAVGLASALLVAAATGAPASPPRAWAASVAVLAAAFAVGLLDDLRLRGRELSAGRKLLLQAGVGALAAGLGLRVDLSAWGPWGGASLGAAGAVVTALWLVAVVNVVNFMDGSDAIVATTVAVLLAAAGSAAPQAGAGTLLPTAAACLGFLAWNAPPAKIFMGDGGSHLLGAAVAIAPCAWGGGDVGAGPVAGAPWPLVGAMLLPSVLDVAEALVHKARHGIPMSRAHHDHLYQRLVKAGGSHGAVALRYAGLALLAAATVGPLAQAVGVAAACAVGALVLAAHWAQGVRRTRRVARLTS